ncbi:hypothetical protein FCM35_KLT21085 [Carex littledalei]|uniref:Uncharacterized protein n=1 Tax=Carex littledalei TaxID=544730 RepID=A0A833VD01_9POAL|nr:hypothetical protein FCM35_KLT21085 [Carex littledalei]
MRGIWRTRNEVVYGGKARNISTCNLYTRNAVEASKVAYWCGEKQGVKPDAQQQLPPLPGIIPTPNEFLCFVDGSWSDVCNGRTVEWVSQYGMAADATQIEARAVLEGCKLLAKHASGVGTVVSDSKEIVTSVNSSPPGMHDWRASAEVWRIWVMSKEQHGAIELPTAIRKTKTLQWHTG